jgi:hypothetical protein
MIYFYNSTGSNPEVIKYRAQLNENQRKIYEKIVTERLGISIKGYILGFMLSLLIIYYYYKDKRIKPSSVVCIVLATSFLTNYFFYSLSPKTDWMLNHVESKEQTQAWLQMYRTMQFHYHAGLVLGIVGMGVFAYAFRC